ncbi:hypothetical protein ACFHYQ_09010 [Sphaerimonospora cavernae]|uniref:RNase H type-1 domain-containing protein n=1 Tax=Sphaerimonospora cavernae TaxID=1740611 RepID=A0ABV6U3J6_9ACTN
MTGNPLHPLGRGQTLGDTDQRDADLGEGVAQAAVDLLLTRLEPGTPLLLLVDSMAALDYLRWWQTGDVDRMPPGYSLRPRLQAAQSTLVRLTQAVAGHPRLEMDHMLEHRGHPLNETADALASIALRRADAPAEQAAGAVKAFLRNWHAS